MPWLVAALFALTYVGISARRVRILPVGRPAMALLGACAVVVAGGLDPVHGLTVDEALHAVEPHTLALLLGMMVVAGGLSESGFFAAAARVLAARQLSHTRLLFVVTVTSGLLSALLVNDAVCLLATPFVVGLARSARAPLLPFVFGTAMGANAGSALTLSGNPQNMLVASLSGLSYRGYLFDALVPTTLALLTTAGLLHLFFRRALREGAGPEDAAPVDEPRLDRPLLGASLAALGGTAVANVADAPLALSALVGAAVVIVASRERAELLLSRVDWSVLLFFAALFVLVAALQKTQLPAQALLWVPSAEGAAGVVALTAVLSVGSQIVSNVPLILLLEPWIRGLGDPEQTWTLVALVSTLAGNLTLLGSVANIIVIERAKVSLGFFAYLKVGVPVTVASTLLAVVSFLFLSSL